MQQLHNGDISTTFTLKFILAIDFHYVAELSWEAWAGIHQRLGTGLTPKLGWSQDSPDTELKGRRNKTKVVCVSCFCS